jgi:hypothetical protein
VDIAAEYTLNPPSGPDLVFNSGVIGDGTDVFFLTDIKGLDSAGIRHPQFFRPLAHGGYKPTPWIEEPLHPAFEGAFLTQSVPYGGDACRQRRNEMYHALKAALRACYDTPGSLSWTELGVGSFTLPVSYEVELGHGFDAGYSVMTFRFGLYSEASQPVAA